MTNRITMTQSARAARVVIGCICCLWAAAVADPAPEPSHTLPPKLRAALMHLDAGWAMAVETKLDHWAPTKENDQVPIAALRSPQMDISGKWAVHRGLDGSSFTITRSGPDSYDITLDTQGCTGWWTLRRTGHYSGGVLVLNRPVQEYYPLTYQKLYAIRAGGTEFLVPDVAVGRFQNGVAPDGSWAADGMWVQFYAFTRTPPTPEASKRGQGAPRTDKPR